MNESASFPDLPPEVQAYIRELEARNAQLSLRVRQLEEQFRLAQLKRYAPSSEKRSERVFNEAEQMSPVPQDSTVTLPDTGLPEMPPAAQHKRGRKPLPADLPRKRVEYDLSEDQKVCRCCQGALHRIGEDISEQLHIPPATPWVWQHVRFKYGCRHCEQHGISAPVVRADMPAQPLPGSVADAATIATVMTGKYADGMPLYRMEAAFARAGIEVGRGTMGQWMIGASQRHLGQPPIHLHLPAAGRTPGSLRKGIIQCRDCTRLLQCVASATRPHGSGYRARRPWPARLREDERNGGLPQGQHDPAGRRHRPSAPGGTAEHHASGPGVHRRHRHPGVLEREVAENQTLATCRLTPGIAQHHEQTKGRPHHEHQNRTVHHRRGRTDRRTVRMRVGGNHRHHLTHDVADVGRTHLTSRGAEPEPSRGTGSLDHDQKLHVHRAPVGGARLEGKCQEPGRREPHRHLHGARSLCRPG